MAQTNDETTKRVILGVVSKVESVKKVREFMIADLEKTIELAYGGRGAPNFLIALTLSAYTEYWGHLLKGISDGKSEECYKAFFERLGDDYRELINRPEIVNFKNPKKRKVNRIYYDVRCGLVHSYAIEESALIKLGRGPIGLEYDSRKHRYTFNILTYFDDFKDAVDRYVSELLRDENRFWTNFEKALKGKQLVG